MTKSDEELGVNDTCLRLSPGEHRDSHSIPLHRFTQPCLYFPSPSDLLKDVKAEVR